MLFGTKSPNHTFSHQHNNTSPAHTPRYTLLTSAHMERYQLIDKIGEGTYGVVYRANDLYTDTVVALKYIRLEIDDHSGGVPATAIREISILSHLEHPNIVKLSDVLFIKKKLILSFEFLQHDLRTLMDNLAPMPLDAFTIKSFLFQLLQAMAYCHRYKILHRDLKPQNILINSDGVLKVADFGLARPFAIFSPHRYSYDVVTLWYRAPELLLGLEDYSNSVDIWSVGCIFAELVNHTPLFTGGNEYSQLKAILALLGTPTTYQEVPGYYEFVMQHSTTPERYQLPSAQPRPNPQHAKALAPSAIEKDKQQQQQDVAKDNNNNSKNATTTTTTEQTKTKNAGLPFPTSHGDVYFQPYAWQQICPRLQGPGLDLLSKLLALDPHKRISASDALAHPFFADLTVVDTEEMEV